jgi:hypothetical protein
VQHLGAAAGDLLGLVVVQLAQQPRRRHVDRGFALNMPGTSVQISRRFAVSLAAKYAPDVSEPPRPSSTVSPAALLAMKPCVMITPPRAARLAASCGLGV